jgi:protein-S-isoprenylcysteine O-methyltransferase Ste14
MNIISPKTMWSLIVLVAICSFSLFDHEYLYIPHIISKTIFIVCALLWLTLICSAFFVHREAYKNSYATSGVMTKGIYKKMKHPMYVGDIALFIGIAFLFPITWVFVAVCFGVLIFLWFMKIEDGVLRERFGAPSDSNGGQETRGMDSFEEKKSTTKKRKKEEGVSTKKERKPRISKTRTKKETAEI